MSSEKLPHATFQEHPPTVLFDDEQLDGEIAAELFGAMALHLYNAGVRREEVMRVGDLVDVEEGVGFRLEPDTEATRIHGAKAVEEYNREVGLLNLYSEKFVHGLGESLLRRAANRVQKKD
jgi:hypothetical protein